MCPKVNVIGVELYDTSAKKWDSRRVTLVFLCQVQKNLPKNTKSATGCCVMSMLCFINGWMGTDDQLLWGFVWNDGIHAAVLYLTPRDLWRRTQLSLESNEFAVALGRLKFWNFLFSLIMMGSDWFNLLPGFMLLAWIEKMILIACVFNPFHMVGHQTNWSDHHFKSGMYSERQWQRNRMVDLFAENLQSHF